MDNESTTKTPIPTRSEVGIPQLCTLHFSLCILHQAALYTCRDSSTNRPLFAQNKPNLRSDKTNATFFAAKVYENKPPLPTRRKRTQSNPIPPPQNRQRGSNFPTKLADMDAKTARFLCAGISYGWETCSADRKKAYTTGIGPGFV